MTGTSRSESLPINQTMRRRRASLLAFDFIYSDSPPAHVFNTVMTDAKWDDKVSIEVHAVDFAGWVVKL